jgi:DNA-binding protein HU-beta
MTKADLLRAMTEKAGLSKTDAEAALKAFCDAVTDALMAGEKVTLVGFGTFSVGKRAARTGMNLRTGQKIQIAAAKVPKFKPSPALKAILGPHGSGEGEVREETRAVCEADLAYFEEEEPHGGGEGE